MATVRTAVFAEEDPEDTDFVCSGAKEPLLSDTVPADEVSDGEHSGGSVSEHDGIRRPKKRRKIANGASGAAPLPQQLSPDEVNALWATFDSDSADQQPRQALEQPRRKIKITRTVQFAGERQQHEVEVWDDSDEAVAFMSRVTPNATIAPPPPTLPTIPHAAIDRSTATLGQGYEKRQRVDGAKTELKPGPKRSKGSLAGMAASISSKASKVSSLEKSKLDWNRYVDSNQLAEDLERGRKDSYSDRQAFIERTQARADDKAQDGMRRTRL